MIFVLGTLFAIFTALSVIYYMAVVKGGYGALDILFAVVIGVFACTAVFGVIGWFAFFPKTQVYGLVP